MEAVLEQLGEDPQREGLARTPKRIEETLYHMTEGYRQDPYEIVNGALFSSEMDEMVIVKDIELYSMCEHHMLPFMGHCHVGYLPRGKVVGLSKIPRVVDIFARRLQLQERLTKEIAESIMDITGARGVGVIVEAQHMCMMMRGVTKQSASMKTSMLLGTFRSNPKTRNEFLSLLRSN
jgi:GTP cyclohydrolase I